MPTDAATLPRRGPTAPGLTLPWQRLVAALLALCMASGCIAFVEPSPYDLLCVATLGLWLLGGFTIHPLIVPFAALIVLYNLGGFFALIPYLGEPDPTTFMVQSIYLALTAILFAIFFAEDSLRRTEVCLKAFALGCIVAAITGIMGYFNIAGTGDIFTLYGRGSGTFKDPNVLGSYLVLGALYYIQTLMLGRTRHVVAMLTGLLIILAGIFLSFSRGSWGVTVGSAAIMVSLALITQADRRIRRRIVFMLCLALALAVVSILVMTSIDSVREMLVQRFALVQDYDGGETGRFGNQLHAIPMLLERLNGFGPVRFRLFFDEDSHSSYIGSFSSYGWLGGASFFLLVGLTIAVGTRLVFSPSPYQRPAQVFFPCLFALLIQAFQIDIDHWRHIYMMLGAVWGLEMARMKWAARTNRLGPAAQAIATMPVRA